MNDYLSNLLARSLRLQTAIQPRRLGRYEPLPPRYGSAAHPGGLEEFEETRLAEEGVRALEPSAAALPAAPLMAEIPSAVEIGDQASLTMPSSSFQADRPPPGQASAVIPAAAEATFSGVPRYPSASAQSDAEPDRHSLSVSVAASAKARGLGQGSAREVNPVTSTAPVSVSEPVQTLLEPATVTLTGPSQERGASGGWGRITRRMGRAERERSETHHSPGHAETMGFAALRSTLPILQQDRTGVSGQTLTEDTGVSGMHPTEPSPNYPMRPQESFEVTALELPAAESPPSFRAAAADLPERTVATRPVQARPESPGRLANLEQPPGVTPVVLQPRLSPELRPRHGEPPHPPAATAIQAEAPVIQVTIGRIEIRATPPASAAPKPRSASPRLTLEDYLRQRNGGKR